MGSSPWAIPELPDTTWAYLAGLFDGEGSIAVYQNGPRMSISNTYLEVLEWVRDSIGKGSIVQLPMKAMATKPCYMWSCGGRTMRTILPLLLPYLRVKKARVLLMLEYFSGVDFDNVKPITDEEKARREGLRLRLRNRGNRIGV